jgi:putative transposase
MSYQLICLLQQKAIPVQQSCRVLEVSRSGFYEARSRLAKPMICKTSTHLRAAFMASHQCYGSRRLVTALEAQGIQVGRYRVRHLMRQAGLKPVWKRKFIHTTDSNTICQLLPIFWIGNSIRSHPILLGWVTSPIFAPAQAGSIWR